MGFRRLTFLLSVTSVLLFAACGDNLKPVFEDAAVGSDMMVDTPDGMPDALMCTSPEINCGGMCVNPNTDVVHCGTCTTTCSGGTPVCDDGHCCATGQIWCGTACVDPQSDEANCGDCAPANGGTGDVCV